MAPCYQESFHYHAAAKALAGKLPTPSRRGPPAPPPSTAQRAVWQDAAIDLTKASAEAAAAGGEGDQQAPGLAHKLAHKLAPPAPAQAPDAAAAAALADCVGVDISRILQSGLVHPVTGQVVNGSLKGELCLRTRAGRRRNADVLYADFKSRGLRLSESPVRHTSSKGTSCVSLVHSFHKRNANTVLARI